MANTSTVRTDLPHGATSEAHLALIKRRMQNVYPTADRVTTEEWRTLGLTLEQLPGAMGSAGAQWNGEKRKPKKGEWYLSGARNHVAAYRAPNDLSSEYNIAVLVPYKQVTRTTTTWERIK